MKHLISIAPLARIVIIILFGLLCRQSLHAGDTTNTSGQVLVTILILDYDDFTFEGGHCAYYSYDNSANEKPRLSNNSRMQGDFGSMSVSLSHVRRPLFIGSVVWAGSGKMSYPDTVSAKLFARAENALPNPDSLRYIDAPPNYIFAGQKQDSIWQSIADLHVVHHHHYMGYEMGVVMYAPAVGMFDSSRAKWVVFLYSVE